MITRKANKGELENIIKVANKSFATVRYENYNFKQTIPYIYNSKKDYSDIHYVCENERKEIIAVGGNLIRKINIDNNIYFFSNIGTISTLPEFRNQGFMSELMKNFDQENINKEIVFSILTGDRKRYLHYGFEKSIYSCIIKLSPKFFNSQDIFTIEQIQTSYQINKIFEIYCQNVKLLLRNKNNFIEQLKSRKHNIYILKNKKEIIGYFSINRQQDCIDEFYLKSLSYLKDSISSILSYFDWKILKIFINLMDTEYFTETKKYAEELRFYNDINIKVYDIKKFVEFAFYCTKKVKNFKNSIYFFKIDNKNYKIKIKNNNIDITEGNFKTNKNFTSIEFIDYILNPINFFEDNKLNFVLDFNYPDLF